MRQVQNLPFCYLCGEPLAPPRNRDHVPPSSIFLAEGRDFPLVLPAHVRCNSSRTDEDRLIGGLVGVLHGKPPDPRYHPINPSAGRFPDGSLGLAVTGFDLRAIIRRWVRGFHAALYREYLADDMGRFMTTPPLAEGDPLTGQFDAVQPVVEEFVDILKRNRATATLDRIVCRNNKCVYECVWEQADRGQWHCIFALDLYGWIELGDGQHFAPRGCVGAYRLAQGGTPKTASVGTRLVFPVTNRERLDPFGN